MSGLVLRYSEDRATGLPRLDDPTGSLAPTDLEALRGQIDRHFERLTGGRDGQVIALNGPPVLRHFRVTVTERDNRCPTLLLEAVEPPQTDAEERPAASGSEPPRKPPPASPRWQSQFLAELADALGTLPSESDGRQPLAFVLSDLRALVRKKPDNLAMLLLAGYLHVGDTLSLKHGEPPDNPYARAAGALVRLAGDSLMESALDPLL